MKYPLRAAGWRGLRVNDCAGACEDPTTAGGRRFTVDGDTLVRPSPSKWPTQSRICINCTIPSLDAAPSTRGLDSALDYINDIYEPLRGSGVSMNTVSSGAEARATRNFSALLFTSVAVLYANRDLIHAAFCITEQTEDRVGYGTDWRRAVRNIRRSIGKPNPFLVIGWDVPSSATAIHRDPVTGQRRGAATVIRTGINHPYIQMLGVIHGGVPPFRLSDNQISAGKALASYFLLGAMEAWGLINAPIYPQSAGRCRAAIRTANTFWWLLNQRYPTPAGACGATDTDGLNGICLYNSDYLHVFPAAYRRNSNCPVDPLIYSRTATHWAGAIPNRSDPEWRITAAWEASGRTQTSRCCWPPMRRGGGLTSGGTFSYGIDDCDERI